MGVLETVDKLIELAARDTTPENEARNAALRAVKMIREHDLKVVDGSSEMDPMDFGAAIHRAAEEAMRNVTWRRRWPDVEPARARPRSKPKPKKTKPPPEPPKDDQGDAVVVAKHAGICSICSDVYGRGEKVIWMPDKRTFCHTECYAKAR